MLSGGDYVGHQTAVVLFPDRPAMPPNGKRSRARGSLRRYKSFTAKVWISSDSYSWRRANNSVNIHRRTPSSGRHYYGCVPRPRARAKRPASIDSIWTYRRTRWVGRGRGDVRVPWKTRRPCAGGRFCEKTHVPAYAYWPAGSSLGVRPCSVISTGFVIRVYSSPIGSTCSKAKRLRARFASKSYASTDGKNAPVTHPRTRDASTPKRHTQCPARRSLGTRWGGLILKKKKKKIVSLGTRSRQLNLQPEIRFRILKKHNELIVGFRAKEIKRHDSSTLDRPIRYR